MQDGLNDETLRDSEIAMIDALKLIVEVLVARNIVPADVLEKIFAQQRDGYIGKAMPNAAVVMEVLRSFAKTPAGSPVDPEAEAARRRALEGPPQGSA